MKKVLSIVVLAIAILTSNVHASFPVNQTEQSNQTVVQEKVSKSDVKFDAQTIKNIEKVSKKNDHKGNAPMDTEFLITLLLCLLLGGFAAHRWYAGKPAGWNILFILTAGGCGIWWLVDLINILTKNF